MHGDAWAGTRILCFGLRACPGCRRAARGFSVLARARALDAAGLAREFSVLACARALDATGRHADYVDWPIRVHSDTQAGTRIQYFGRFACTVTRELARGFSVLARARALVDAGWHANSVFWLARVPWMPRAGTRIQCFGSRACSECRRLARGLCVLARARALDATGRHADSVFWLARVLWMPRGCTRIT